MEHALPALSGWLVCGLAGWWIGWFMDWLEGEVVFLGWRVGWVEVREKVVVVMG